MKKIFWVLVVLAVFMTGCVQFDDPQIEALVREQLDMPLPELIMPQDMLAIVDVTLEDAGVFSLGGLEHALNITTIRMSGNNLIYMNPLSQSIGIRFAYFSDNQIYTFQALSNDTHMQEFWGDGNSVTDVSFVIHWLHPWYIGLNDNPISDLRPLLIPDWEPGVQFNFENCPLDLYSRTYVIYELQQRGHIVTYDSWFDFGD